MRTKAKYIRTKNNQIIVFSELLNHSDFKSFEPVSAGFIFISSEKETTTSGTYSKTKCNCYGRSVSLNLDSNPVEDTMLANLQILLNNY